MTETEKRRMELLNHTRKIYSDRHVPPAIHPRFQTSYQSLYPSEAEKQEQKGTFGIRVVISILLFCLFAAAGKSDFDTKMVVQGIGQEYNHFVDLQIFD